MPCPLWVRRPRTRPRLRRICGGRAGGVQRRARARLSSDDAAAHEAAAGQLQEEVVALTSKCAALEAGIGTDIHPLTLSSLLNQVLVVNPFVGSYLLQLGVWRFSGLENFNLAEVMNRS